MRVFVHDVAPAQAGQKRERTPHVLILYCEKSLFRLPVEPRCHFCLKLIKLRHTIEFLSFVWQRTNMRCLVYLAPIVFDLKYRTNPVTEWFTQWCSWCRISECRKFLNECSFSVFSLACAGICGADVVSDFYNIRFSYFDIRATSSKTQLLS